MKKFSLFFVLAIFAALTVLLITGCAGDGTSTDTPDAPETPSTENPSADTPADDSTVAELFESNFDLDDVSANVAAAVMSAEIDAVKTAFPDVNEVAFSEKDFGETLLASRSQYYRFACIDGENVLLAVTADDSEYTALDEILSLPEARIMELGGLNPDTAVSEAERDGVLSTLREAVTRYESEAERLAAAYYATAEYTRIMALTDVIAVPEAVKTLFPNAVALAVGVFTDSMEYTADGNVQGETCKMAYVSAIKADGSAVVYSVTVGEGTDDIASGNIDVAETGEYAFGITLDSLPALSQPVLTVLFDDLYAEVFGADYDLVPFETFFNEVTDKVFNVAVEYKIQFMQLSENGFKLYADCVGYQSSEETDSTNHRLAEAIYKGAGLSMILDYSALSKEIGDEASLKDYLQKIYSTNGKVSANEVERVKAELDAYKTRTDLADRVRKFTNKTSFNITTLISNTTADIDFDEYAAEYTPAGATPLICYVGEMGTKTLNNTFGTGYVQRLAYLVAYLDSEGKLHIKKGAVIVPWYTNSTDEYSYSLALGEEGKDYVTIQEEIISTLEDPIISEWLLPNA